MQMRIPATLIAAFLVLLSLGCTEEEDRFCQGATIPISQFLRDSSLTTQVANVGTDTVRYIIVEEGAAERPGLRDTVVFNYVGKTTDNIIFDQRTGTPASSQLAVLIRGFQVGLPQIGAGGKIRLFIPSRSAYGRNPRPGSGLCPNADLIFDVELVRVGFFTF